MVQVFVDDVLEQVKKNRAEAVKEIETLREEWYSKVKKELRRGVKEANKHGRSYSPVDALSRLSFPALNTRRYDDAILRLEWETRPTIEVSIAELKAWVDDDWDQFFAAPSRGVDLASNPNGFINGGSFVMNGGVTTNKLSSWSS